MQISGWNSLRRWKRRASLVETIQTKNNREQYKKNNSPMRGLSCTRNQGGKTNDTNVAAAKGQKEAAEFLGLMGHRSCKGVDVAVIRRDK